jgi:3-mercaptopyruvate sulfurtransferase SseA
VFGGAPGKADVEPYVAALSVAGITDGADVYIGSWSDWITSPERPIALG